MSAESTDHRKRPRRRGEALVNAILEATIEELAEQGYAALTMEGVAERARASKASLYRRWTSRSTLVMDAVYHLLPHPSDIPDTGGLRGDLLVLLRQNARTLSGPAGAALRGLLGEALPYPEHAAEIRSRSQGMGRKMMEEVASRAVARGEIPAEAVVGARLDVGQALLRNHFLFRLEPIPDDLVVEIVDTVLVPLFHTLPHEDADHGERVTRADARASR